MPLFSDKAMAFLEESKQVNNINTVSIVGSNHAYSHFSESITFSFQPSLLLEEYSHVVHESSNDLLEFYWFFWYLQDVFF